MAGIAGLIAGAMSIAAGEYVSVSSQADTEQSDLARETTELSENLVFERAELSEIYIKRGLSPALADRVAAAHGEGCADGPYSRRAGDFGDQHGTSDSGDAYFCRYLRHRRRDTCADGRGLTCISPIVSVASLAFLALLGAIGARAGGAKVARATIRVAFWEA